ncbi:MAG: AAA family ATPase [Candidatus Sungbacteria bacterium]|nr:AAA family ATPase [Candidatus Sungbacteria bacterium]
MHLTRLELSGFKSFAKMTTLSFPARVTGVVGPNGSGKSNVVESMRWVLGEQSMKSLRGKKGEDLIWNGSPAVPRVGKASVTLIFDNTDRALPFAFDEILISRTIFRDGLNEYAINSSSVRLKDVVELMARIGLGEEKHNIISQGEVDRILLAGPRERRVLMEEALGLRLYRIKKNETERKLRGAALNGRRVEELLREMVPHLKFLRDQRKKSDARSALEVELRACEHALCANEERALLEEYARIERLHAPVAERQEGVKKELTHLAAEVAVTEGELSRVGVESGHDPVTIDHEARQRHLEREIGRLEGRLELEKVHAAQPALRMVDMRYIKEEVENAVSSMRETIDRERRSEILREELLEALDNLDLLNRHIERGIVEVKKNTAEPAGVRDLKRTIADMQKELSAVAKKTEGIAVARAEHEEEFRAIQRRIRELDQCMRAAEEEDRRLALEASRIHFEEERTMMREQVHVEECARAGLRREKLVGVSVGEFEGVTRAELKRRSERLRIKLEEIGGINPAMEKEHEELETRHTFLTRELEDVRAAGVSLKKLLHELDGHIARDFTKGFEKINEAFSRYFSLVFEGGMGSLALVAPREREENLGEENGITLEEDVPLPQAGIEIEVHLPRKRIKGLAMLSGGERALTALALLFAVSTISTSPFLILDETDAALDEANSRRYRALLEAMAEHTQIIVVTHNRETMRAAGVLYGVTMAERGVSTLLSLKFEDAEGYASR